MPEYSYDPQEIDYYRFESPGERQYFDDVEFQRDDDRERQAYLMENPRGSLQLARLPTESAYWTGDGDAALHQDPYDDDMTRIRRYPTFRLFRSDIRNTHWF